MKYIVLTMLLLSGCKSDKNHTTVNFMLNSNNLRKACIVGNQEAVCQISVSKNRSCFYVSYNNIDEPKMAVQINCSIFDNLRQSEIGK